MKRLLWFLLLLGLGLAALRFAIGDDPVLAPGGAQAPGAKPLTGRTPGGVPLQQGKVGATVAQSGPFEMQRLTEIPQPDGSLRKQPEFVLRATDSRPVREDLQQLDGVTVNLFEDGQPVAILTAAQAFVELSRDANGRPSLREDKEVELRDAVFATLPGSRAEGLRLTLPVARVQVREDELLLRTPTEDEPVLLELAAARQGTLRGRGLQARLPRHRRAGLQRADVDVLHDPVLEAPGMRVSAKGRLHYGEDTRTGLGLVTLQDDVALQLAAAQVRPAGLGAGRATGGPLQARGDQFTGWLRREKRVDADGKPGADLQWRLLQLSGAPATVTGPGLLLTTPRLQVAPGLFDEPHVVTAGGGPSRLEIDAAAAGLGKAGETVVGTAPRRIHLVRPSQHVAALHRAFGFPQWSVRPLAELEIVAFDGNTRLVAGGRTVTASQGLHLLRPDPAAPALVARGMGAVQLEQQPPAPGGDAVLASGDDGFLLRSDGTTDELQLGPGGERSGDAAGHRFALRVGAADLSGHGGCRVVRRGDDWLRLELDSPAGDLAGQLAPDGVALQGLTALVLQRAGDEVREFAARGRPARAAVVQGQERLDAAAPRLQQLGPDALVLLPVPADGDRAPWAGMAAAHALPSLRLRAPAGRSVGAQDLTTRAPRIEVHRRGGRAVQVEAFAADDAPARIDGTLQRLDGGAATTVAAVAARLRLLPFVVPPLALLAHRGGATGPLAELPFRNLAGPWLIAEQVQQIVVEDAAEGHFAGRGHRLLLAHGAAGGVLLGDPDRLEPAELTRRHEGRTVVARGARVRVSRGTELRLQALRTFDDRPVVLPPTVVLHQPDAQSGLAHLEATCQGNIDVLPAVVRFDGPVAAQALRGDGSPDPEGLHLTARELRLDRHQADGRLLRAVGHDVDLTWSRLRARGSEAELDLEWKRGTLRDVRAAEVTMPGGRTYTAPWIEFHYESLKVRCYHGRFVQTNPPPPLPLPPLPQSQTQPQTEPWR